MCPSNAESESGGATTSAPPAGTPTSAPARIAPGVEDGLDDRGRDHGEDARSSGQGPASRTIAPVSVTEDAPASEPREAASPTPQPPAPSDPPAPSPSETRRAAAAKIEADKRVDDRAAISLRVDYKRLNTFFADYTKNISKGGTFIRTTKPLDIGTEFIFVLSVPSHNKQLELKGEVVWIVTEETATKDSPAGMGIKFKFVDDSERSAVDDFVEKLMDEALGHHISTKLLRRP
jgi:type IV pilus assembly protein PilZ